MMRLIVAITFSDFNLHGCPHCGHTVYYLHVCGPRGSLIRCAADECQRGYVVANDGETVSPYGFGEDDHYPAVQPHPLAQANVRKT